MFKQTKQHIKEKRKAFNNAVEKYGNRIYDGLGDILTTRMNKETAMAGAFSLLAAGCAMDYGIRVQKHDKNPVKGMEAQIEQIIHEISEDKAVDYGEYQGLGNTMETLNTIKENADFADYKEDVEHMIDSIEKIRNYFEENAVFEGGVCAQYVGHRGDNPVVKFSTGFKDRGTFAIDIDKEALKKAAYDVTSDDAEGDELYEKVLEQMKGKSGEIEAVENREDMLNSRVMVTDAFADALMEHYLENGTLDQQRVAGKFLAYTKPGVDNHGVRQAGSSGIVPGEYEADLASKDQFEYEPRD